MLPMPSQAGSGPSSSVHGYKGDHTHYQKNPNYWLKDAQGHLLPYLDSITYRPITNGSVEFSKLQAGSICRDTVILPMSQPLNLLQISSITDPRLSFLVFCSKYKVAPLNNPDVRRLSSGALNRRRFSQVFLKASASLAGPIPPVAGPRSGQNRRAELQLREFEGVDMCQNACGPQLLGGMGPCERRRCLLEHL